MTKKSGNINLKKARSNKQDEFYTQLSDIEKELKHYKKHFKDKVVYCNCDDPRVSNFFHYFSYNFEYLGLKKLIATCYKNQNMDLFSQNDSEQAIYLEYNGDKNNNHVPDSSEIGITHLKGDGDFRSAECIELLKKADIVVTNPPFSLFREYVAQLIEYDKKFIIIGNKNAITYKEIFKLIKEKKKWGGNTSMSTDLLFDVPEDHAQNLIATKKEGSGYKVVDGVVKGRAQAIWFTNLDYDKRYVNLILYKKYNEQEYPCYENYNAINIDKTKDIPIDYKGAMGVPISFLGVYNPEQFEILALGIVGSINFTSNKKMEILGKDGNPNGKYTHNAKGTLYRKYNPTKDKKPAFRDAETGELYTSIYARIIIKNKTL